MTAAELRAAMERLGLGQTELARELGVARMTVNRWALGRTPSPGYAAAYLRKALRAQELEVSLAACWTLLESERGCRAR